MDGHLACTYWKPTPCWCGQVGCPIPGLRFLLPGPRQVVSILSATDRDQN